MRAIQFDHFGGPDVLKVVEISRPEAGPGEVLVRVRAAGVNFFEVLIRADRYAVTPVLPMAPGVEVTGVVEHIGEGADVSLLGSRIAVPIFALDGTGGGSAEFVTAKADGVVELPADLAFEDGAAVMVQGLTALHLIRQSPPRGKTVLVLAAAGGVGSLLVQMAKSGGARRVIATAGSEEKRGLALSIGADCAIDYTRGDWPERVKAEGGGEGVDLIYETVGGSIGKASLDALAPGGELVFAALGRFTLGQEDLNRLFARNQVLRGFALLPLLSRETLPLDLGTLFARVVSGELRLLPGRRFALSDAAMAHRAIEDRSASGKVVLVPDAVSSWPRPSLRPEG